MPAHRRIRTQFSTRIFGKTPLELREYWLNLKLTRGLKAPKVLRSSTLVKQYLKRVKGGIGYVYLSDVDDSVRVVCVLNLETSSARETAE